jgi:predicted nucleic acid-binding protein
VRLYLDASPIIYAFEGEESLKEASLVWLRRARFDPGITLLTSRLTRLEVRCKPLSTANLDLLAAYDRFLDNPALECVSLSDAMIEAATTLRARRAGAADAIHIATAIEMRCDTILTGDDEWKRFFPGRVAVVGVDRP